MKLKIDRLVAVGLGAALAVGFVISQRPHPRVRPGSRQDAAGARLASAESQGPAKVRIATVEKRKIMVHADGIGTVRSRRQTQIASRVLAEVKEIRKQPGDEVEAGEVLLVLDSLDLKARVDQAEANLKAGDEALRQARTEFERARNLLQKEAVTVQEFDLASFRLAEATARRDAGQKAVEEAKIQLGYATIAAPFKGVIFEKHADPGDLATPGKPLLGLYDPSQLRLEALVDEGLLWKLKVKDEIEVKIDSPSQTIQGQVSEIVPAVDPSTRTGTVKIDLPRQIDLRPGVFGRTRIPLAERDAILVPVEALVHRGQLELCFKVVPGPKPGAEKVHMKLVRLGEPLSAGAAGAFVEVLSGLDPGDRIVAGGGERLEDGDRIEAAGEAPSVRTEEKK